MSKTEYPSFPGLGVWAALLIASSCVGFLIIRMPSKEQQEKTAMQSWLLNKSTLSDKKPLIIILGTSLTGCGLDSTELLEKIISERSGQEVSVIKIWKSDASPNTFSELGTAIEKLKPAVVVTEANMLFYTFSKRKGWPTYVKRFRNFINAKNDHYFPDNKPIVLKRQMTQLETFRNGLMDTTQLVSLGDLLAAWQKQGSRLILLNFPLEWPLEIKKWNSGDTTTFYQNVDYLRRRCAIQYTDPKMRLNELNFIDHAHMNQLGQKKQSLFFCNLVAGQLIKP